MDLSRSAEPPYDLVVAGGRVVDPSAGIDGTADVAVRGGKVAVIATGIDRSRAARVIDASGQIVAPGLVDLHTHIYWGVTYWGIEPDPVAARTGVTTWLDVGSAGAYSWPGFRRYVVEASRSRVFAFLNLSSIGLIARTWELSNPDHLDVDLAAWMIDEHRDVILGVKARIDRETTRGTGLRPLALARELADRVGLPLMAHIGSAPPTLKEILPYLRPGDILTHCFTGLDNRILDEQGLPLEEIVELHDRGLVLDIGHGSGSFSFETAEQALASGLLPDVISSDIHQLAVQGPMFDLPTTLSKFLNLGMALPDVIERATSRPAAAMGRPDLGSLKPGSAADIALFEVQEGDFVFQDIHMNARRGSTRLVNTMTLIAGEELARQPELPPALWADLPEPQRGKVLPVEGADAEGGRRPDGIVDPLAARAVSAG